MYNGVGHYEFIIQLSGQALEDPSIIWHNHNCVSLKWHCFQTLVTICCTWTLAFHQTDITGSSWHLKSPTTQCFIQQLVQQASNINCQSCALLVFGCDLWISLTNGQYSGKRFLGRTSSFTATTTGVTPPSIFHCSNLMFSKWRYLRGWQRITIKSDNWRNKQHWFGFAVRVPN